jgi:hypothetical protein
MVTFRNNNRRPSFRTHNNRRPPFRRNDEGSKFSNNDTFQRKVPNRNNHNAPKLIEKYNEMAREALAQEDRVLSENYFQHADHFTRVQNEQEKNRIARVNSAHTEGVKPINSEVETVKSNKINDEKEVTLISSEETKKTKKTSEKKSVAS